jgi:hypothetical protein
VFCLVYNTAVIGDSWLPPKKTRYCAATGKYCLDVAPKPIESPLRYFDDHVKRKANPGAGPGVRRTAVATLLVRDGREYKQVSSFPISNEVAPVNVLVSRDGKHLVTFDNWHSVGWGDNVVVIYRSDGSLVKKYSLAQLLSEKKVERLPRTVSSIWWGGEHRLDERKGHLVLQIVEDGTKLFDENARYTELRLQLTTGEIVQE